MPQLFMYMHVIQRVLMIATLCSHLSGESCTNGIKMLDGFTKLCSSYKKRGVACQSESIQMDSFCYKQCKSSKCKSKCKQWCRKMIRYGWAQRASFFCGLQVFMREITLILAYTHYTKQKQSNYSAVKTH